MERAPGLGGESSILLLVASGAQSLFDVSLSAANHEIKHSRPVQWMNTATTPPGFSFFSAAVACVLTECFDLFHFRKGLLVERLVVLHLDGEAKARQTHALDVALRVRTFQVRQVLRELRTNRRW